MIRVLTIVAAVVARRLGHTRLRGQRRHVEHAAGRVYPGAG